ncbi:GTPase domain-containing protein [Marinimicrobium locisalis]|uniref:GTPase domain-containing protein n=1 Tax=Marinimicrobium locisalis TaxID=546022 RepID=UPI0032221311
MKDLIHQFGRLRLLALALTFLPLAAIPLAGVVWLWQTGYLFHWLLLLALCAGLALLLQAWLAFKDRRRMLETRTRPDGNWSATAEAAWTKVEALAQSVEPQAYSWQESTPLWSLGQETLEQVAHHFFPDKERPLLELTLPHALLIVERASRELRKEIVHTLPFSHRFSVGTLVRARSWQQTATRYHNAYRLGRALLSPAGALYKEFNRAVGGHILDYGSERLQRWLLQEYVRKVGFYAIELYSGNLLLSGELTSGSGHPIQVVVFGPAQSGKTTVVDTFAGEESEPVPERGNKWVSVHRLNSSDWGELELWDTAAWKGLPRRQARRAVASADLIIWVSHAVTADVKYEAEQVSRLKRWLASRVGQPEPPLLVVLTHSEQVDAVERKERTAEAFAVAKESVVALSAKPTMSEASATSPQAVLRREPLHAAFVYHYSQVVRCQYWRYLHRQRRAENRELAGRQLRNVAGSAWKTARGVFRRHPKR